MRKSFCLCAALALSGLSFVALGQIGNPAPNFTVKDTHGKNHTLYNYLDSGRVVVLDFFYTTCGPCQFYSPQVNLAYEKYGCNDDKVLFMSIDYGNTDAQVLAYDNTYQIEYPSVSGLNGGGNAVVNQYQILGFPTFYVIDSTKKIVAKIDPPTLQVFDYRFNQLGILPAACLTRTASAPGTKAALKLYPNPVAAGNDLVVAMPKDWDGVNRYEILDFTGRVVQDGQMSSTAGELSELRLHPLSSGTFLLKVQSSDGKGIITGTFVVE